MRGQYLARRALEIAAAGGHDLLFEGPPGSGKTMLARRMPGILPPLTDDEALECALVHGAVRALDPARLRVPPFRSPHHTASPIGLAGGGNPIRPGEISLAHQGVLFLDELPEFSREALEVLREPMEERVVHITRAGRVRDAARARAHHRRDEPVPVRLPRPARRPVQVHAAAGPPLPLADLGAAARPVRPARPPEAGEGVRPLRRKAGGGERARSASA